MINLSKQLSKKSYITEAEDVIRSHRTSIEEAHLGWSWCRLRRCRGRRRSLASLNVDEHRAHFHRVLHLEASTHCNSFQLTSSPFNSFQLLSTPFNSFDELSRFHFHVMSSHLVVDLHHLARVRAGELHRSLVTLHGADVVHLLHLKVMAVSKSLKDFESSPCNDIQYDIQYDRHTHDIDIHIHIEDIKSQPPTMSPSFTNHSVSCTSAMPSPMSASESRADL